MGFAIGTQLLTLVTTPYVGYVTYNPSDVSGTTTYATSWTDSLTNAAFFTPAFASNTLTVTLVKAGKYKVTINLTQDHGAAYTDSRLELGTLGGTSTAYGRTPRPRFQGIPNAVNSSGVVSFSYMVDADAGETITVKPAVECTGSGATGDHTYTTAVIVEVVTY